MTVAAATARALRPLLALLLALTFRMGFSQLVSRVSW